MNLGLQGKIVTGIGSSRGIDRAVLKLQAQKSSNIAFFCHDAQRIAATVRALNVHAGKVSGDAFDTDDGAACGAALGQLHQAGAALTEHLA